jgi:hypothetical protein
MLIFDLIFVQGTFPFVSERIIRDWYVDERLGNSNSATPRPTKYTAIDDVESFLWVLLYTIVQLINSRSHPSPLERWWKDTMDSKDLGVQIARIAILVDITELVTRPGSGAGFEVVKIFEPVLTKWGAIARDGRILLDIRTKALNEGKGDGGDKEMWEASKGVYGRYIRDGFECLEKLPETWGRFFCLGTFERNEVDKLFSLLRIEYWYIKLSTIVSGRRALLSSLTDVCIPQN